MDSRLLITALILYILSLAASLVLAIASKKFRPSSFRIAAYIHLLFASLVLISLLLHLNTARPYFILFTVCSALAVSGWALRTKTLPLPLRIYFGLYLGTVIIFLFSPSLLVFTVTGLNSERQEEKLFNLGNNYYLVEQSALQSKQGSLRWKLIKKSGIYKKTIQRDLMFDVMPDSVRLLELNEDTIRIREYHHTKTGSDSSDSGYKPISSEKIQQKQNTNVQ